MFYSVLKLCILSLNFCNPNKLFNNLTSVLICVINEDAWQTESRTGSSPPPPCTEGQHKKSTNKHWTNPGPEISPSRDSNANRGPGTPRTIPGPGTSRTTPWNHPLGQKGANQGPGPKRAPGLPGPNSPPSRNLRPHNPTKASKRLAPCGPQT